MSDGSDSDASPRDGERRGLDAAFDLGVFAPLGFALQFRTLVPELAEAGRRQVAFSQSLGKAAIASVLRAVSADGPARPDRDRPTAPSAPRSPVDNYDDLTAREVIELLGECSAETAAWVGERENSGKGRVTVLRAVTARTKAL